MMRALPSSDITSMLTSVTADYDNFVETSGLAAQPTDSGAFLQLENDSHKSEQLISRQRSYSKAILMVFLIVVAATSVATYGLVSMGRQAM
jgi:hypothetical protein